MSTMNQKTTHRAMTLDEAINTRMDPDAWKAYIELHEVRITRRDD